MGRRRAVVVVDDPVVDQHPADVLALRARRRAGVSCAARADPVLRRGRVVVVLALRRDALLVVVEFGVLDRQVAAGVRARVAEVVVLGVRRGRSSRCSPGRRRCSSPSRTCCWRRCSRTSPGRRCSRRRCRTRRRAFPCRPSRSRSRSGIRPTRSRFPVCRGAAAVEPDRVAAGVGAEEVARREVLQAHAAGLVDDDRRCCRGSRRLPPGRRSGRLRRSCTRGEPGLVPSIITVLRFIPRMCRFGRRDEDGGAARVVAEAPRASLLLDSL